MTTTISQRLISAVPRLIGRVWNDVTRELEDYLRKVADSISSGIPGGFLDRTPNPTAAVGDPGTKEASWMAADATIPQGIVRVKGDILTYSSGPAAQGVGSDTYVPLADSSSVYGWRWAAQTELTSVPGSGGGGGGSGSDGGWVRHFMMLGD